MKFLSIVPEAAVEVQVIPATLGLTELFVAVNPKILFCEASIGDPEPATEIPIKEGTNARAKGLNIMLFAALNPRTVLLEMVQAEEEEILIPTTLLLELLVFVLVK